MQYAIKAEVQNPLARSWTFEAQKTMYGGKNVQPGDRIFVLASENEGGLGLIAQGCVTSAEEVPQRTGIERQTPRVTLVVKCLRRARLPLGRAELKRFSDWTVGRAETELNFKFYRQATNKVIGLTEPTADFLDGFF